MDDVQGLDIIKIPSEDIWPLANPEFTRAPDALPPNAYLKRPCLFGAGCHNPHIQETILSKVEVCEVLKKHPHPNFARYLGCVVKEGRVRGLAFTKYSVTLDQMLKERTPFDKERCLRGIEAGVYHM
ncbi:hypothetical protein QBC38DRAFT_518027, partial [Podospora fimiseda]